MTTDVVWGEPIEVNGARPAWLGDDSKISFINSAGHSDIRYPGLIAFKGGDVLVRTIYLPADHLAYTAIAKGFTPWGGGSEAPEDWDGDPYGVLYRDGETIGRRAHRWMHYDGCSDIIGYHRKPIAHPSPADTVTIAVTTEAEAIQHWKDTWGNGDGSMQYCTMLRKLGVIRPVSPAQRIATKTNLPLADVERVIAPLGEEG